MRSPSSCSPAEAYLQKRGLIAHGQQMSEKWCHASFIVSCSPRVKQLYWNVFCQDAHVHCPGERVVLSTYSQRLLDSKKIQEHQGPIGLAADHPHHYLEPPVPRHFLSILCSADIFPPPCDLGQVSNPLWSQSSSSINEDNNSTHLTGFLRASSNCMRSA